MSPNGKKLTVSVMIPPIFYDPEALFKYQYDGGLELGGGTDNMYEANSINCQDLQEKYSMEDIKVKVDIMLPFTCHKQFEDPYNENNGYEHTDYPYKASSDTIEDPANAGHRINAPETRTPEEINTRVFLLQTTLKAVDVAREGFKPTTRRFA
jgi:hypothetical protein